MTIQKPFTRFDILEAIRAKGISSTDISDDDMFVLIDQALKTYAFFRPKKKMTAASGWLTTVANQPNYDFPDDAFWIIDVAWNPDYSSALEDLYEDILLQSIGKDESASLLTIQYRQMANLHKYFGGRWEIQNDEIYLIPAPSLSDLKVAVYYASDYTLAELGQIKDNRFFELVYAMALERKGMDLLSDGGWSAGTYKVDSSVARETLRLAEKKKDTVLSQLANSYTGQRS